MRGGSRERTAAGRHTLGSLPESQEPVFPAVALVLPAVPPAECRTDGAEPLATIYGATWLQARERAHAAGPELHDRLVRMLDMVETAWVAVRELQHWVEAHDARSKQADAYGHALSFIDADVVDLFREVANGVAQAVPGWDGWGKESDPESIGSEVDMFLRYLAMLHYAALAAPVPKPFSRLVASVAQRLSGWGPELVALVTETWSEDGAESD